MLSRLGRVAVMGRSAHCAIAGSALVVCGLDAVFMCAAQIAEPHCSGGLHPTVVENVQMPVGPTAPQESGMPYRPGLVRFAVGSPHGLGSNSWRFWTTRTGDAYLACRD